MSKKLIMSVCTGVLALSAFALASSASAQWRVGGTNLTGTAKMVKKVIIHHKAEFAAAGVTITCVGNLEEVSSQIEAGDKASAQSLVFTGCSASEKCTVTETLGTVPVEATAALGVAPAVNVTVKPKTKTTFATIKFEGSECALLGTQTVTGTAKVLAPTGQTEKEVQLMEANTSAASGELKVGSSAALLRDSSLLILEIGLAWGFL
ncbi:MAG TPA: hypothetical protein VGI76_09280 [Solirubrobacteraceae bacterium]|jgi:hypothetical protein